MAYLNCWFTFLLLKHADQFEHVWMFLLTIDVMFGFCNFKMFQVKIKTSITCQNWRKKNIFCENDFFVKRIFFQVKWNEHDFLDFKKQI